MLFAPTLADKAILPTAWGGRYFFNRIGRSLTVVTVTRPGQVERNPWSTPTQIGGQEECNFAHT
ncbi:hypothetical protein O8J68_32955, partial [Pseudomonas aeruginosa]|uniref:hypothetical protein n=1 Tax=Pseudomonas aeruginosa TaxID=287 RepID=UPI0022B63D77